MPDVLELLFFSPFGVLIGYAFGAAIHIEIDQIHGKRLLRKYWDATDKKIAGIEQEVTAGILAKIPKVPELPPFPEIPQPPDLQAFKAELLAEIPEPDIKGQLEEFLRSEPGKQWAAELADLAATDFERAFVKRGTDAKGANHRHQQSQMGRILLDNMDFGDSRMNAVWAFLDPDTKREAARRISQVVSRAGFVLIPTTPESAELAEGEQVQRALPPPIDWDRI